MTDVSHLSGIPFSFFVSLCKAFGSVAPKNAGSTKNHRKDQESSYFITLKSWVRVLREQHSPLPEGTAATFFRLLFPQEDVSKKFGLQETRLAGYIADIIGVSTDQHGRGACLRSWSKESAIGCLGQEVRKLMEGTSSNQEDSRSMSDINELLTELASTSAYSSSSVRVPAGSRRKPREILRNLYISASPMSAAVITQVILKDLRPVLYPLKETHYTAQLLQYNSKAICMLTKEQAMKVWDPTGKLSQASRVCASIEDAVAAFEHPDGFIQPKLGVPIPIPKCIKGKGCKDSLNNLGQSSKVWVETKYDGERAQIHVEVDDNGNSKITIFSKSKRDSTLDRYAVHPIIREALGLPEPSEAAYRSATPRIKRNVVIEAEMVAYSSALGKIDEFWRIRSLVGSTALGVRGASYKKTKPAEEEWSQSSLISDVSDEGTRHLALVFFDVLVLDSESLLWRPYAYRRAVLESLVVERFGHAMLAERVPIPMHPRDEAEEALRGVFAKLQTDHQEGAILKADESRYNDWKLRWVKLKADYIPGYGDCVDLVLLGAGWDKERARELLVGPSVYTTFYIGALLSAAAVEAVPTTKPSFQVIFTCSYGLTREQLEGLNFLIKSSDPVDYAAASSKHASVLPYSFTLNPGLVPPSVMLQEPILVELYGAGFTKAPRSKYYELRFPRMTKFHRASERSWRDGSTLDYLQRIAREAVGRDRQNKDVDDWCKSVWGKPQSPGVRCLAKRKAHEEEWFDKLERADGKVRIKARRIDFSNSPAASTKEAENIFQEKPAATSPKTRAFGSVTNILPTPLAKTNKGLPADVSQLPTPRPTASRPKRPVSSVEDQNAVKLPSIISSVSEQRAQQERAVDGAEPSTPRTEMQGPLTPPSTPPARRQDPFPATPCSIRAFLQHAAVYLAVDPRLPRPGWRAPIDTVTPHYLHAVDALLIACGWGTSHVVEWARFGVIFVDDEDESYSWVDGISQPLVEMRARLLHKRDAPGKPVVILGMSMLHKDKLDDEVAVLDRAICRFG